MEFKTQVSAPEHTQSIIVTREFELPLDLLFEAFEDPMLFEQWMNTKVVRMECMANGAYAFQTQRDGLVVFSAHGCFHEFTRNQRIVRTFEMDNTPFPPQLEFFEFESIDEEHSRLTMIMLFKSAEFRNQLIQMPFAQGIQMAHNKLQQLMNRKR